MVVHAVKVCFSASRHCVECQHFQRGQYSDDNSCNRICRDEIKAVEKLGENHLTLSRICDVNLFMLTVIFLLIVMRVKYKKKKRIRAVTS